MLIPARQQSSTCCVTNTELTSGRSPVLASATPVVRTSGLNKRNEAPLVMGRLQNWAKAAMGNIAVMMMLAVDKVCFLMVDSLQTI